MTLHPSSSDDLSEIVQVIKGDTETNLTSKLITRVPLRPGQVLYPLKGLTLAKKRYTTVQVGKEEHMELNSDLVYMNHSCDPSVVIDVTHRVICVAKNLKPGDEITFFYPSTEWDMDQPFPCWCGSEFCLKSVRGAKYLDESILENYVINRHVVSLFRERAIVQ